MKTRSSILILFNSQTSDYVLLNLGLSSPPDVILTVHFEHPFPINIYMQYCRRGKGGDYRGKTLNFDIALLPIIRSSQSFEKLQKSIFWSILFKRALNPMIVILSIYALSYEPNPTSLRPHHLGSAPVFRLSQSSAP